MSQNSFRTPAITNTEASIIPLDVMKDILICQTTKYNTNYNLIPVESLTGEDGAMSLTELETEYGIGSAVAEGVRAVQYNRQRHNSKVPTYVLVVPQVPTPYADATGILSTEIQGGETISFGSNRAKISSIDCQGTITQKCTLKLFLGTIADKDTKIGALSIDVAVGDTGATLALAIADAVNDSTKIGVKAFVANSSFTKYRGVVADFAALIALSSPTDFDVAYVTSGSDFFYYQSGRWNKTYLGISSPVNTMIYFINVLSGEGYNATPIYGEFYDKNGVFIAGDNNIVNQSIGFTAFDIQYSYNTTEDVAGRSIAGVGMYGDSFVDSQKVSVEQKIFDMLATQSFSIVYWGWDDGYNSEIANLIEQRAIPNDTTRVNTQGKFYFSVTNSYTGEDSSCDAVFYDSNGNVVDAYKNGGQVILHKRMTFKDQQINPGINIDPNKKPQLYRFGSICPANPITEIYATYSIDNIITQGEVVDADGNIVQEAATNMDDIFSQSGRTAHYQNCNIDMRHQKISFINKIISVAGLSIRNCFKESNNPGVLASNFEIANNKLGKYPISGSFYNDGGVLVRTTTKSLTTLDSVFRDTSVYNAVLLVNLLATSRTKTAITQQKASIDVGQKVQDILKQIIRELSTNQLAGNLNDTQSPVLDPSLQTDSEGTIRPQIVGQSLDVYMKIGTLKGLVDTNITIQTINN